MQAACLIQSEKNDRPDQITRINKSEQIRETGEREGADPARKSRKLMKPTSGFNAKIPGR